MPIEKSKTTVVIDFIHEKESIENTKFYKPLNIKRIISINNQVVYSDIIESKLIENDKSILRQFELWLLTYEKPQTCTNSRNNRCNFFNSIGHRWFKTFNFKQKFLNIFIHN